MRVLHLQSFLSIRILTVFAALAGFLFAMGVIDARAESTAQQVEAAWNNLRATACANARSAEQTSEAARLQEKQMEQALRNAEQTQNVPEDVVRDSTRAMQDAMRDMRSIARDVGSISKTMGRICTEDIRLSNIRDAAKKYDDRRQDINEAADRFRILREEYGEAIRQFNGAATDLAMHGSTLNQLETE